MSFIFILLISIVLALCVAFLLTFLQYPILTSFFVSIGFFVIIFIILYLFVGFRKAPERSSVILKEPGSSKLSQQVPKSIELKSEVLKAPESIELKSEVLKAPESIELKQEVLKAPENIELKQEVLKAPKSIELKQEALKREVQIKTDELRVLTEKRLEDDQKRKEEIIKLEKYQAIIIPNNPPLFNKNITNNRKYLSKIFFERYEYIRDTTEKLNGFYQLLLKNPLGIKQINKTYTIKSASTAGSVKSFKSNDGTYYDSYYKSNETDFSNFRNRFLTKIKHNSNDFYKKVNEEKDIIGYISENLNIFQIIGNDFYALFVNEYFLYIDNNYHLEKTSDVNGYLTISLQERKLNDLFIIDYYGIKDTTELMSSSSYNSKLGSFRSSFLKENNGLFLQIEANQEVQDEPKGSFWSWG